MRFVLLCCATLLFAAPTASAHDDPPEPPKWLEESLCALELPLWDYAMCLQARAIDITIETAIWGLLWATYAAHQAGCHVVGGPACIV